MCACLWGGAGGVAQAPPRPEAALSLSFRLVSIHQSGWKAFDVTEAVNFWQQLREPRQPLLLQVSVHREHLGSTSAQAGALCLAGGGRWHVEQAAGKTGPFGSQQLATAYWCPTWVAGTKHHCLVS